MKRTELLQPCVFRLTYTIPESLENVPMGDESKWLLKERGVGVFSRVVIFLSKIRPPHTQLIV